MTDPIQTTSRRWRTYSLRALLALTVLMAIPLAWLANRAAAQRRAVQEIEKIGGRVLCFPPWGPSWLHAFLGKEIFTDVEQVFLREADADSPIALRELSTTDIVTDDHLAAVAACPRVRIVEIWSSHITDEGMRHLARAPSITELEISGRFALPRAQLIPCTVTAAGVAHLARLPKLEGLVFVGNADLKSFRELSSLKVLMLNLPKYSQDGMQSICELVNLEYLSIYCEEGPGIEYSGVEQDTRTRLPNLKAISLTVRDASP